MKQGNSQYHLRASFKTMFNALTVRVKLSPKQWKQTKLFFYFFLETWDFQGTYTSLYKL